MTALNDLITGDDETILVTCTDLNADGTAATVTAISGTITAILMRGGTKLAPATYWTCTSGLTGADWTNRIVAIPIAAADTTSLSGTARDVIVEVKVVSGSVTKRYHTSLEDAIKIIKKGH